MPCRDDYGPTPPQVVYETPSEADINRALEKRLGEVAPELLSILRENANLKTEIERAKEAVQRFTKRNDLLARMLCELLTKIGEGKPFQLGSIEGLEQWWTEHQMFDEQRKMRGEA